MKKIITANDIKRMGFTEEEKFWFEDIAEDINKSREENTSARLYFRYSLYTGPIECFPSMYAKAVKFYAKRYIIENGGYSQVSLRSVARYIASKFYTYPDAIIRELKGLSCTSRDIYVTDTFGLDVFQYEF